MKTLVDKTYNNPKIKEINTNIHLYLSKQNLNFSASDAIGGGINVAIVRKGELFTADNILFTYRSFKSYTPDNAYNSILSLLKSLMDKFGWDEELSRGKGWMIEEDVRSLDAVELRVSSRFGLNQQTSF